MIAPTGTPIVCRRVRQRRLQAEQSGWPLGVAQRLGRQQLLLRPPRQLRGLQPQRVPGRGHRVRRLVRQRTRSRTSTSRSIPAAVRPSTRHPGSATPAVDQLAVDPPAHTSAVNADIDSVHGEPQALVHRHRRRVGGVDVQHRRLDAAGDDRLRGLPASTGCRGRGPGSLDRHRSRRSRRARWGVDSSGSCSFVQQKAASRPSRSWSRKRLDRTTVRPRGRAACPRSSHPVRGGRRRRGC